jgi:hypothetical protein
MDITIHHVELSVLDQVPVYVATTEFVHDDGSVDLMPVIMPTTTFESMAAEYDVSPNTAKGWADLLALVFGDIHHRQTVEDQIADPDALWNAPSVAHARKAKLAAVKARLGKGKLTGRPGASTERATLNEAAPVENSDTEDPIEFIKRTAPMSASHIKVKREHTRRVRNHVRARRRGGNPVQLVDVEAATEQATTDMQIPERETADQLATRLLGQPLDDDD